MNASAKKYGMALIVSAALVSGCATTDEELTEAETTAEETAQGEAAPTAEELEAQRLAAEQKAAMEAEEMRKKAEEEKRMMQLKVTTFYFDLDQSEIMSDAQDILKAHALYLTTNPNAKAKLAGHCDERGTREYNLALGERRGNAVAQFLMANGVQASQLEVVSYGEEQPAASGSTEESWAQNRRVVIEYM